MFRFSPFSTCAAAAAFSALLLGGCAGTTTGRVRDAHLLWDGNDTTRKITQYRQAGPFYEQVKTAGGASRTSVRPLLYSHITAEHPAQSHTDILWPVYAQTRNGASLSWRFLIFFGLNKNTDGEDSRNRTWLFPFWFQGTAKDGQDYAALWPFYGTIREMYWDKISFTLFPFWVEWNRNNHHTWSALWPIVMHQTGPDRDAWRVFPFWGRTDVFEKETAGYILWPFWTQSSYAEGTISPGKSWMLWPLAGHVDRKLEERWMFLPPFFSVAKGKEGQSGYRSITCPWPLVMLRDTKTAASRTFFPFYRKRWTKNGSAENRYILWPFWNDRRVSLANREISEWSLFPILHQSTSWKRNKKAASRELDESYLRVWPLYSRRYDPENRLVKIPDLTLSRRAGALERNLLGMFTLYTRGEEAAEKPGGKPRVDHTFLWGMIQSGSGENYSRFQIWPLWNSHTEKNAREWSFLGGLVGRRKAPDAAPDEPAKWRFFWFF